MIDIDKAFEGRWRIKGNFGQINSYVATMTFGELFDYIKLLCRDFFEAGVALGQRDYVPLDKLETYKVSKPLTPEECINVPPDEVEYINDALARGSTIRESDVLTVEELFKKWWDMYDLKCGKENCIKKWNKLTTKERFDCIKATPAYVASTPDKQFRKRPLTYLNQKAWNDEIIPRNNGTNKSTIEEQRDKLASILTD
jgi:hypothetical protein